MKIDRLVGILSILLEEKRVTASKLAERFGVARRTIDRDVEDLNRAGIPVSAQRGKGGGLYIVDSHTIDSKSVAGTETLAILTGLKSLDSVDGTDKYHKLMNKLTSDGGRETDSMIIDMSDWSRDEAFSGLEVIRTAIEHCRLLRFSYMTRECTTERVVEPYRLIYQQGGWYLWGWCIGHKGYCLFRISGITDPVPTGDIFESRMPPDAFEAEYDRMII